MSRQDESDQDLWQVELELDKLIRLTAEVSPQELAAKLAHHIAEAKRYLEGRR